MKYARDSRTSLSSEETAQLLFEALPWMKNLTGKTVVIKYGGAAMVDERLRADVMSDIVLLKIMGMKPVIVHGGGKDINAALKRHEIPVEFRGGQRVTSTAILPWACRAPMRERLWPSSSRPSWAVWGALSASTAATLTTWSRTTTFPSSRPWALARTAVFTTSTPMSPQGT